METHIKFINESNKDKYLNQVIAWLKEDYLEQGEPENHFWHNIDLIESSFDEGKALVVVNATKAVIGYMIWNLDGSRAEINIVEVNEACRGQGVLKKILLEFTHQYSDIAILTASVLPQSERVFAKLGWAYVENHNHQKKYFSIVKPIVLAQQTLLEGRIIAVCSEDPYKVKSHPNKYKHLMKYFPVELDTEGKLSLPIITDFNYEGYVGIYMNKESIIDGKAKHLFQNTTAHASANLLIIDKIIPYKPEIFYEKGFLLKPSQEPKAPDEPYTIHHRTAASASEITANPIVSVNKNAATRKRKRVALDQAENNRDREDQNNQPHAKKLKTQVTNNTNQFFSALKNNQVQEKEEEMSNSKLSHSR